MTKKITILFEGDSVTANQLNKVDTSIGTGYPFASKTFDVQQRLSEELDKYKPILPFCLSEKYMLES